MRILLTETDVGGAADLHHRLVAEGHEVVTCHEPGTAAFPCRGLAGHDPCPLDAGGPVDVAIAMRSHPYPRPRPREAGVTCALRANVPLVTAGSLQLDPFSAWSTQAEHQSVEEAIAGALHRRDAELAIDAAAAAQRATDGVEGITATAKVTGAVARIELSVPAAAVADQGRIAVRVHGELRAGHPELGTIDIAFNER